MDSNPRWSADTNAATSDLRTASNGSGVGVHVGTWRITFEGHEWTDEDVNAAHLFTVAELLDKTGWDAISPWSGPRQLMTWLAVLTASAEGVEVPDALQRIFALNVSQLLDTLATRD